MPSRTVCWAIVVIWLATMTWFVVRDVVPMFETPKGPQVVIDLTDEVGSRFIRWDAYQNGEPVGRGRSYVKNAEDRSFELGSEFAFDGLRILNMSIHEKSVKYNVDKNGRLLRLEMITTVTPPFVERSIEIKVTGKVKDGVVKPKIKINGQEMELLKMSPIDVDSHGSILNTMHLVRRLRGLHEGKSWTIPLLDPIGNGLPTQGVNIPTLRAIVKSDSMTWEKKRYACYKIEYRKPNSKEVRATTWVRKSDGAVLKQVANYHGMQLVLLRTRFVGRRMPFNVERPNAKPPFRPKQPADDKDKNIDGK